MIAKDRNTVRRLSQEAVRKRIEAIDGYELIDIYQGGRTPILIRCPEGHEFKTLFGNFDTSESRCPKCALKSKYTYEEVKAIAHKKGFLIRNYDEAKAWRDRTVEIECYKCANISIRKFCDFLIVKACLNCRPGHAHTEEFVIQFLTEAGYKLLSPYRGTNEPMVVECPSRIEHKMTFAHFKLGYRCCHVEHSYNKKWDVSISEFLRSSRGSNWAQASLKAAGNKCVISGSTTWLQIHHPINFTTIVETVLNELGLEKKIASKYSESEIEIARERVRKLEFECGLGTVMRGDIHKEFHNIYGIKNNSRKQIEEFVLARGGILCS